MRIIREDWFVIAHDDDPDGLRLAFGDGPIDYKPPRWPDPDYPQQMHLDISVDNLDTSEHQALRLGASKLQDKGTFRSYSDPAGHPFCLYPSTPQPQPTKTTAHPSDPTTDHPTERTPDHPTNRMTHQRANRTTDHPTNRTTDRTTDRTTKDPASRATDDSTERTTLDPSRRTRLGRIERVVIDCFSPRALAAFYAPLLDMPHRELDTPERVVITRADGRLPALAFQHAQFPAPRWPDPASHSRSTSTSASSPHPTPESTTTPSDAPETSPRT
ncbi:hypothetical protein OG876_14705 [Kribbella sp. NBC_00359]